MSWFSAQITLKASDPQLGVVEVVIAPGDEPPLHIHRDEDEWFYVLDGEVTFHVGEDTYRETAGAFVSFPRGIAHTFTIESGSARFLVLNTPGGFERMFERAPRSVEDALRALNDYGMDVVGPHPRETGAG
jgi:quercetin dioxygenase-like cupin family protein